MDSSAAATCVNAHDHQQHQAILEYLSSATAAAHAAAAAAAAAAHHHYSQYHHHHAAAAARHHHHPYYRPGTLPVAPHAAILPQYHPRPVPITVTDNVMPPPHSTRCHTRSTSVKHLPSSCSCRLSSLSSTSATPSAASGSSSNTTERHGKGAMPSLMDVDFLVSSPHSCPAGWYRGDQGYCDDGGVPGGYNNSGGGAHNVPGGYYGESMEDYWGVNGHHVENMLDTDEDGDGVEAETHISHLFPEILAMIFEHLPLGDRGRAAQVCRAWRDASYTDKRVWRGVDARLQLRRSNPTLFQSLQTRGIKRIQVLSLRRSIKDVIVGIPGLTALNLSGCFNVTDIGLSHAFNQDVPRLTELNLSLCKQITDTTLGRIAQHVKNLEVLDVAGCCDINDMGLLLLTWGLRRLRSINLRSCRNISDVGVSHLTGVSVQCQGEQCGPLEYLGLQDCQKITDLSLKYISQGVGDTLKSLNLSFCASITDHGLKYVCQMRRLDEVNLRSCDNITDAGIVHLMVPTLSASPGPASTSTALSQLEQLDVSFCDKVGDVALTAISERMPGCRELSLAVCAITDNGLHRVVSRCKQLRTLNIGQCALITDLSLQRIVTHCPQLNSIDLYGCSKLTTAGIDELRRLPNLNILNLHLWQQRGGGGGSGGGGTVAC